MVENWCITNVLFGVFILRPDSKNLWVIDIWKLSSVEYRSNFSNDGGQEILVISLTCKQTLNNGCIGTINIDEWKDIKAGWKEILSKEGHSEKCKTTSSWGEWNKDVNTKFFLWKLYFYTKMYTFETFRFVLWGYFSIVEQKFLCSENSFQPWDTFCTNINRKRVLKFMYHFNWSKW